MNMARRTLKQAAKLAGGIVGLLIIMVWASGALRSRVVPGVVAAEPGEPLPADAVVVTARIATVPVRVALAGTVQSERHINLSARLPAYVEAVHVSAGATVQTGDLLIELDQRELREELAAAQAQLAQAETAYRRSERLLETNATTAQAHEAAEAAYRAASATVERVNVMLSHTRITAPLDGVVADRFIEAGDLASPGQVLLSVYDPARLRLEVPVPARLVEHFPVGRTVQIDLDQSPAPLDGTVTEVVSAFDPVTRTRRVKVRIEEADAAALPGMYGQALFETDPHDAVLLPADAVQRVGQLERVALVRDGRIHTHLVRTGARHGDDIEIRSGLAGGEAVMLPESAP